MSTGRSTHDPPSGSRQNQSLKKNTLKANKLPLTIQIDGTVVGKNASKWSSRTGDLIRAIIPIHYKDWTAVPKNFKDDVWKNLMDEFDINLPEEIARPLVCKNWSQFVRTHKHYLRTYIRNGGVEAPEGTDPVIWQKFIEHEREPKKIKQNHDNAENRKKSTVSHTLGRQSYGQKAHIMEEKNPGKTYGARSDKWLLGHEDGNGVCSSESAKPYYEIIEKRKSEESSSTTIMNDVVAEVLGSDKKGRVRGMGSHVTQKQVGHISIAQAKDGLLKGEKDRFEEMKNEIKEFVGETIQGVMSAFLAQIKSNDKESSPQIVARPRSDLGSNSIQKPQNLGDNVEHVFSPTLPPSRPRMAHNPPVILIDDQGKELANGYVVTDSTANICHGKKVGIGQRKVHIEEVFEPDALIWGAKDGNDTFAAYATGGYLVWFESWLTYL